MNEQENKQPKSRPGWWKYVFNVHVLLLLIVIFIIVFIVLFIKGWGVKIDDDYIDKHGVYTDGRDCFDDLHPLTDAEGNLIANKSPHTILFFGNGEFARNRDSADNVVNMIAKQTGATVYNCSVSGSYLAALSPSVKFTESGLDVYNFYWLCLYLTWDERLDYFDWLESQPGANILPETDYLRKTLETIDMNKVDTIAVMYDGSDYLESHNYFNTENPTDVMTFTGNLAAGIDVLQAKYPHVRIIVLSPTYAFGVDDDGSYVSSDLKELNERKGREALSTYVLKECETTGQRGVSFLDNLYGTFNEDEASEYLEDHLHLNQKGRELLVKRFISALTLYDK